MAKILNYIDTINVVIATVSIIAIVILYYFYYIPVKQRLYSLEKAKQISDSTNLHKQGGTTINGKLINYNLRSWDGGKNWYAVDYNFETKEFKIIGEAEKVYPGLLHHLATWERLTNYVKDNGPISMSDKEAVKMLEEAGFSFHKKQ